MNGSGKEVLLTILRDLSTRRIEPRDLAAATRQLRGGLLTHGSTAEESIESAHRLVWASDEDPQGDVRRQGIALARGGHFVSDLYERVFAHPGLREWVVEGFPELEEGDYDAFEWVLWLLVSMVQMFPEYEPIERSGDINVSEWVEVMARASAAYFKERER